jgi:hypothetical protein
MRKGLRISRLQATIIATGLVVGVAAPAVGHGFFGHTKSEHWGVITRNTIGSPVADLRDGPFGSFGVTGDAGEPPFGKGSLGIAVANNSTTNVPPSEKVDFGNEVDFFGDPVLALFAVGFHVFQTGENVSLANGGPTNMPNVKFEIDPNLAVGADSSPDYTTMVWLPAAAPVVNQWSGYLDATNTGTWFFTGGEGAATGCSQATPCTFAAAKAALADGGDAPIFYSVAVGKGRDNNWVGAVDGLRINFTIYDFEEGGVKSRGLFGHH